jgi:adenylate kinase family enzyme
MKKLGFDLILLGDVAAGKDTQAAILMKQYALKPVETGKYWRSLGKKKNLSKQIQERQAKSLPAPVQIIKDFLIQNLEHVQKNKNLVFVGGPKLKPEAAFLKQQLLKRKRDFLVVCLTLPKKEIIKRSLKRMRNIDDSKYIYRRINWYRNQQGKTLKYFRQLGKLKTINANQSISKVTKAIEKVINDYSRSKRN